MDLVDHKNKKRRQDNNVTQKKNKLGKYYLLCLSIVIIVVLVCYFNALKVDFSSYSKYLRKLNASILNDSLLALQNANTIGNLPDVVLNTTNDNLNNMANCKDKLKHMGSYTEDKETLKNYSNLCKTSCGGAGELLLIKNNEDYVFNNEFVNPGVYCTVQPHPCNMNTGYVIASINSVVCRSKYPRLFGGPSASTTVACNDEHYPSTGSVLWDASNNR